MSQQHWDTIYREKGDKVSWYEENPHESLVEIKETLQGKSQFNMIDVGSGKSVLVDNILEMYPNSTVTLLDLSQEALDGTKARLGDEKMKRVEQFCESITTIHLKETSYDIWHDRAVLHFLKNEDDQKEYVKNCHDALKMGGTAIIMTFSDPDGPEKCSGLEIVKYNPETLAKTMGNGFNLLSSRKFIHGTPSSNQQVFICCRFEKI